MTSDAKEGKIEPKYERAHCAQGYHIYQEIWDAAVGKLFAGNKELRNLYIQCHSKEE